MSARSLLTTLLLYTLCGTAGAQTSDAFQAAFVACGLDGDLVSARGVLAEWTRERPDDPMLPAMRGLLIEWQSAAVRNDGYAAVVTAITTGDLAAARRLLERARIDAPTHSALATWIERFTLAATPDARALLVREFAAYQGERAVREVTVSNVRGLARVNDTL